LAAGCEADSEEDRGWVTDRWNHMRERLRIDKVETCYNITMEVWARRDMAEAEKQARMTRFANSNSARQQPMSRGGGLDFSPPNITRSTSSSRLQQQQQNDPVSGGGGGIADDGLLFGFDDPQRSSPMSGRRVTFDNMPIMIPTRPGLMTFGSGGIGSANNNSNRRAGEDFVVDKLEFDYTVKGRLHWLGVMMEQDWEGESLLITFVPAHPCSRNSLTSNAMQCHLPIPQSTNNSCHLVFIG
jgi:hypothetical protein